MVHIAVKSHLEEDEMLSERRTVLIVEDDPDTAEMFAEMMQVSGYRVQRCLDSTQALHWIAHEQPNAILLDIMMPILSGLDLLRHMRRDPRLSTIPVIIVSARGSPVDIQLGLSAGARRYLTKPVGFGDLKKAVEEVLVAPTLQ